MSEFFSCLPLSDRKTLPSVKVVYKDMDYAAGMFYPRCLFKYIDHDLDMDRGKSDIIVLSIHWGEPSGSTVAHEHRHFQQYYFLGLPKIGSIEHSRGRWMHCCMRTRCALTNQMTNKWRLCFHEHT